MYEMNLTLNALIGRYLFRRKDIGAEELAILYEGD